MIMVLFIWPFFCVYRHDTGLSRIDVNSAIKKCNLACRCFVSYRFIKTRKNIADCYLYHAFASGLATQYVFTWQASYYVEAKTHHFYRATFQLSPGDEYNWWASAAHAIFSGLQLQFLISIQIGVLLVDLPTATPWIMFAVSFKCISHVSLHAAWLL